VNDLGGPGYRLIRVDTKWKEDRSGWDLDFRRWSVEFEGFCVCPLTCIETNNQANRAYVDQNPEDEDPPYAAVACDVAIQTAKPKALEVVMNLDVGEVEGNPISGLMVALDMVQIHKHTKSWSLEIVLITDGQLSVLTPASTS
jgi:hypothetical protein